MSGPLGDAGAALEELLRIGTVAEIGQDGRVRVTFPDRDDMSSAPMPVLHRKRGDQDMPGMGEPVLCLMMPPDLVDGFVLGTLYDRGTAPPVPGTPAVRVLFGDDIRFVSEAAAQAFILGQNTAQMFNGHTHMTQMGPSGPPQEGVLTAPMDNLASPTYPHLSTKIKGE